MELQALLDRAMVLADEGDWDQMAQLLREHLLEHEAEAEVHCWLGVAERELGLEGVAYERFRRALALNPEDPYVLATAGNGVAAFDDPDAEVALRTASLIAPDVALTRLMYGAWLAREGFAADGLRELTAARALDPDDPQIAYELGVARYLSGDLEGAADAMGEATSLEPEDGWGRIVMGLVLLEADRLEEALGELTEGAQLHPEDVEAQLAAALAAAATGAEDLAYGMLERARIRAADEDSELLLDVEERVDLGPEAARALLMEELAPDMLRRRAQVRP
ncbi:MAG TPA: tetratricopeptide repeat protein [Longimicrobiales bacterium]|nr:tetratricopeptide repeat protein [Longimicrobiales bacterium]